MIFQTDSELNSRFATFAGSLLILAVGIPNYSAISRDCRVVGLEIRNLRVEQERLNWILRSKQRQMEQDQNEIYRLNNTIIDNCGSGTQEKRKFSELYCNSLRNKFNSLMNKYNKVEEEEHYYRKIIGSNVSKMGLFEREYRSCSPGENVIPQNVASDTRSCSSRFSKFAHQAISGNNISIIRDVSLSQCKQLCLGNAYCRSLDYGRTTEICFLSDKNSADVRAGRATFVGRPAGARHWPYDYHERDCR